MSEPGWFARQIVAVTEQIRQWPASLRKEAGLDVSPFVEQPEPKPNELPAVWDLVIADMRARDAKGVATYRTRLQPHNGRDGLRDLMEELLDAVAYTRQLIYERDGK